MKKITEKENVIYYGGSVKDGKTRYQEIAQQYQRHLEILNLYRGKSAMHVMIILQETLRKICAIFLYGKDYNMDLKEKMVIQFFNLQMVDMQDFLIMKKKNMSSDWGCFESIKAFVKENKVKGPVVISNQKPDSSGNIEITYVKDYVPQHVYKTFVKCVIGLIGNESLFPFVKTIDWLRYGNVIFSCQMLCYLSVKD